MHARDILEVAALVACHGPTLAESRSELPSAVIEKYWSASKCRLDRWGRTLKQCSQAPTSAARGVIEEILASEVLTRVWTATMVSYDGHRGVEEASPPARSIFAGHLEARGRALRLLLGDCGLDADETAEMDCFRRRTERWSDFLLARLATTVDLSEFAHDVEAVQALGTDLRVGRNPSGDSLAWKVVLASLRTAFHHVAPVTVPNADLAAQIGASVLAAFGTELFDSLGLPSTLWTTRLMCTALDAQALVADLFVFDDAPLATSDFIIRRDLLQ